jgi:hypothetical protein
MEYTLYLTPPLTTGVANGWVSIQGTAGNCAFTWLTSPYGDGKAYLDGTRANMINNDAAFYLTNDPAIPLSDWAVMLGVLLIALCMW